MGPSDDQQPQTPSKSTPTPTPSRYATAAPASSGPTIAKTGEIMLGFALAIVFVVVLCVTLHLVFRKGRRRKPKRRAKKDIESQTTTTSELHSTEKSVFEAAGTAVVLCELPEAPPIQEMEGDLVMFSPIEPMGSGESTLGSLDIEITPVDNPWPEGRELAIYWAAR